MPTVPKWVLCFALLLNARVTDQIYTKQVIQNELIPVGRYRSIVPAPLPFYQHLFHDPTRNDRLVLQDLPSSKVSQLRILKFEETGLTPVSKEPEDDRFGFLGTDNLSDELSPQDDPKSINRIGENKPSRLNDEDEEDSVARIKRDWENERGRGQLDEKVPYEQHVGRQLPWREHDREYYPSKQVEERPNYPANHPVDEPLNDKFEKWSDKRGYPQMKDQLEERPGVRYPDTIQKKPAYPVSRDPPINGGPRFDNDKYSNLPPPATDEDLSQIYPWRRRDWSTNGDDKTSSERLAQRIRNSRNSPTGNESWFDAETFMKWLAYKIRAICQIMVEILMAPMMLIVRWIEG